MNGPSEQRPRKAAAAWLFAVAAATAFNSLLIHKYTRFVDFLVGLSFTQFIDAVFVGRRLEPPGSPYWWVDALPALFFDALLIVLLLILAVRVLHGRRRATQVSFWFYAIDTCVFVLILTFNAVFHTPIKTVALEGLTVFAHVVGLIVLFRARRTVVSAPSSAQLA